MHKFLVILAATAAFAASACNTVEGAGEDVSSAGRAVSDAAE
jgi:predicted small secreted protein